MSTLEERLAQALKSGAPQEPVVETVEEPVQQEEVTITEQTSTSENEEEVRQQEERRDEEPLFSIDEEADEEEEVSPFKGFAQKLGVEASQEDELVEYVSNLKKSYEELQNRNPYPNEELAKAAEIAAKGGDWKDYLKLVEIDYSTLDDLEIAKYDLRQMGISDDEIELMDENQLKVEGRRIKQRAEADRKNRLKQIEVEAEQRKAAEAEKLQEQKAKEQRLHKELYESLQKTADTGFQGIKMNKPFVDKIHKKLVSGRGVMDMFLDSSGNLDPNKVIETALKVELFDKVLGHAKTVSKNAGKREVMNSLTNPNLSGKPSSVTQEEKSEIGQSLHRKLMSRLQPTKPQK